MKNNDKIIQTPASKELYSWLKGEAEKNNRSVAGQNRHYLELIKSGKIKGEGVG
jgi:hypothetical protein